MAGYRVFLRAVRYIGRLTVKAHACRKGSYSVQIILQSYLSTKKAEAPKMQVLGQITSRELSYR